MTKLKVKQIEAAKPGPKDVYLRDGDGLELRIFPSGRRVWQLRYRYGDKRRVLSLGGYEHVTLVEARNKAHAARGLIERGIDPIEQQRTEAAQRAAEQAAESTIPSVSDLFDNWMTVYVEHHSRRPELYKSMLKDFLASHGELKTRDLTRAHVAGYIDKVLARGARVAANRKLAYLKQMLAHGEARGYLDSNPAALMNKRHAGGHETPRNRVLSEAEIRQLLTALPDAGLPDWAQQVIRILLATGARSEDIVNARWEHLDLAGQRWHIPEPKQSRKHRPRSHDVFLSDYATRAFKALSQYRVGDYILTSSRKPDQPINDKTLAHLIGDRQGGKSQKNRTATHHDALVLPGGRWTAHDLRRSCAAGMTRLGIDPFVADRCLGHALPSRMMEVYQVTHSDAALAEAWRRWGRKLALLENAEPGADVVPLTKAG